MLPGSLLPVAVALALAGCALPSITRDSASTPALASLAEAGVRDLRPTYRATLCAREGMTAKRCERTLRGNDRAAAPLAPPADPREYRLVFVPGFLSGCFPGFNSFADAIAAARAAGFDATLLDVGGRATVEENGELIAQQLDGLPDDGRSIILFGHSKGVVDALEALVQRPELGPRVAAVVGIAGAFRGSPLADRLRGFYRFAVSASPLLRCEAGSGAELDALRPAARRAWWNDHRATLNVPLYAIVTAPEPDRVSPVLGLTHAALAGVDPSNDGQLLSRDEIPPGGALLGVINADHLEAAIPRPHRFPWNLLMSLADVPRADIVMAAVDVIAADRARVTAARGSR